MGKQVRKSDIWRELVKASLLCAFGILLGVWGGLQIRRSVWRVGIVVTGACFFLLGANFVRLCLKALRVLGEVEAAEEHDAPGEGGQGR